jgi:hypothetical protein
MSSRFGPGGYDGGEKYQQVATNTNGYPPIEATTGDEDTWPPIEWDEEGEGLPLVDAFGRPWPPMEAAG